MNQLFLVLSLLTFAWMNLVPQSKSKPPAPAGNSAKILTLTGTSFDEKNFVSDADQKIWTVTNRAALSGHATEHVRIVAQLGTSQDRLVVKSITAIRSTRPMPANGDDQLRNLDGPRSDPKLK